MSARTNSRSIIQIHDLGKVYSTAAGEFTALSHINADVQEGEFLGIIGKSGAGKSTLLNMINGVDRLTSGKVVVRTDGNDISVHELNEDQLALWRGKTMGIVYQSFQLLPMLTLVDNITLPIDLSGNFKPREVRERAMELLQLVELEEHANKLPAYISGGEQQRVAIARALANDPPILVADEPTGSLDSITADHIFDVFEHLVADRGKTIVMVTHDNGLSPRFSRHLQLVDGEIASETGSVNESEKKRTE
jgi:putative ABC transport system ATP-binding protein